MTKQIDVEKLRALGVPEEVIASMDIRDGGNIDPQGNVLFLDEDRLISKENPDKPLRKNKPNGLGIKNKIFEKASMKLNDPKQDSAAAFEVLLKAQSCPEDSIIHKAMYGIMGFSPKGYTGGTVLPLNLDFSETTKSEILPIDLVFDAIETADYVAIMDKCICRTALKCQDYPLDLGCIFLNRAGKRVVSVGAAKEATVEQAKAHVLRAQNEGLFCCAERVDGEQLIWGLHNDEMNEFLMLCFCCPCCCLAFKGVRAGNAEEKKKYKSCGYTATANHDLCAGCGKCASECRASAISYREDGKSVIDQDKCMGCGWCTKVCSEKALQVKQTYPLRANINEYVIKEHRVDDGFTAQKYMKEK